MSYFVNISLVIVLAILSAFGTFFVFHWLDTRASTSARKAISAWIQTSKYDKRTVYKAIVHIFDRLYGKPLLSLSSFARIALYSLFIQMAFAYEFGSYFFKYFLTIAPMRHAWSVQSSANILSDYISLMVVRTFLRFSNIAPLLGLLIGSSLGVIMTGLCYLVISIVLLKMMPIQDLQAMTDGSNLLLLFQIFAITPEFLHSSLLGLAIIVRPMLYAAFAVHLWFVALAVGAGTAKLLNSFSGATRWTQWFLKRGRDHPLDAIGYVTAVIVFMTAVTVLSIFRPPLELDQMNAVIIKSFGAVGGVGGLALGVFLLLNRDFIRKAFWPKLPVEEAYRLLRLFLVLVWSVAIVGIAAWVWVSQFRQ